MLPKLLKTKDIKRAVECHDDLVAALKAAQPYLGMLARDGVANDAARMVDAAIAKAQP